MEDGASGSNSMIWFLVMLILEMVFYGFSSAMQNRKVIDREENGEGEEAAQTGPSPRRQARLTYMLDHHARYATATQLGVVTINLLLGAFILYRLNGYFTSWIARQMMEKIAGLLTWQSQLLAGITAVAATVFLLYIIMTIGVMVPKKAASKHPDIWIALLITPFYYYVRIVAPFCALVSVSARALLHLLGVRDADDREDVTEEEILSMVNVGHEQGILHANEAEMINNIFEYGDKEAKDIMINRNNLIGMDCTMTLQEAAAFIVEAHNSRFPVYDGTIDHIVGILHLKDAMRFHVEDDKLDLPVRELTDVMREPYFVPRTKNIDELFREMQKKKLQMVIVVDEYGQTDGLVAMEDILEEIVGNILDEYDEVSDHIEEKGDDEYVMEGKTPLEELEEHLGISFHEEEFDTLNGFLIARLDKIPEPD